MLVSVCKFWNNVKPNGIKTQMQSLHALNLFWNNDKQHGIKTIYQLILDHMFWNNDKQHGIKTGIRSTHLGVMV